MAREFYFKAFVRLTMSHEKGSKSSRHEATDIRLDPGPMLDKKMYLKNDLPTHEGSRMLTEVLVAGLVANIHNCHHLGHRDSAEHLRHIIAELERGFVAAGATVTESTIDNSELDNEEELKLDIDMKAIEWKPIEGNAPEFQCNWCGKKRPGRGMLMCEIPFAEDAHCSFVMCDAKCRDQFVNEPRSSEYVAHVLLKSMEQHKRQQ